MEDVAVKKIQIIKQCISVIEEIAVPQHLQSIALQYLLSDAGVSSVIQSIKNQPTTSNSTTYNLREYISSLDLKAAVIEIPTLLYWAKVNENKDTLDEKGIIELYRRAGLRPPKNVAQSLRDLASKRYDRLETVAGQPGFVRLSRVGEDYVIHDVLEKMQKKAG